MASSVSSVSSTSPSVTMQFDKVITEVSHELLRYHAESLAEQSSPIVLTGTENPQALTVLCDLMQLIGATKRGHKDPPLSSNILEDQYLWDGKADFELCAWMRKTFPYPDMKDAKSKTERPYSPDKMDAFMNTTLIRDVLCLADRLQMKHLVNVVAVYFTLCLKLSQDRMPKSSVTSVSSSVPSTVPMDTTG